MAVERRVQVVLTEGGFARVQRDTIIDPESGIVVEREKVVGVDFGEGKVAVMEQAKVKALVVPNVSVV